MEWKTHRVDELEGHPVQIELKCDCVRVKYVSRDFLKERLGPDVTFAEIERRMRCPKCKQRPEVRFDLPWELKGGRDRRPLDQRVPLPSWIPLL